MKAAEGFGGDAMKVDPATLVTIAGTLDDSGAPLLEQASALQASPDAGASTGLVADALQALSTAVAGLSGYIGDLASSTGVAAPTYVDTDHGSGVGLREVLP